MKHIRFIMFLLIITTVLAACGNKQKDNASINDQVPKPLLVDLVLIEKAEVGQKVEVVAHVTQGDEKVTDATEVVFEVVGDQVGKKEMIDSELKDKSYVTTLTFDQPGTYAITSHVTARNMHTMPTKEIEIIGEATEEVSSHNEESTHHHAAVIQFEGGQVNGNETNILTSSVTYQDAPLTEARVRFEIWQDGSEKHDWLEATEGDNGTYDASYDFPNSGEYFVQVHVEKGQDIHDHITKEITVE